MGKRKKKKDHISEDYPVYFLQLEIEELSDKGPPQLFFSFRGEKEFHEAVKKRCKKFYAHAPRLYRLTAPDCIQLGGIMCDILLENFVKVLDGDDDDEDKSIRGAASSIC